LITSEEKLLKQRAGLMARIANITDAGFDSLALAVFTFQAANNPIYGAYLRDLGVKPQSVKRLEEIPFLPISAFRHHDVQTLSWAPELVFTSSGTTGAQSSRHLLRQTSWYRDNARRCFSQFYGKPGQYALLALLPAYLERTGSSLVYMAQDFIASSAFGQSGFFLHDTQALRRVLEDCRSLGIPTILLGVSFALWDFVEAGRLDFPGLIVMETGGMKGRREEITRESLHDILRQGFGTTAIHSEYGMTELLSQAYSKGEGRFHCPSTMRVSIRDIYDPFEQVPRGRSGLLNITDLANLDTISFIATDDLGRSMPDGGFEVIGRLDHSEIRGCNLLVNSR
jgi:phenylacetate-coenzyme A ligase PaaK-like adenylate-forming protein